MTTMDMMNMIMTKDPGCVVRMIAQYDDDDEDI